MTVRLDPWRTLAHDGAERQEIRAITTSVLVDYTGASWREWETLHLVAVECAALARAAEETNR